MRSRDPLTLALTLTALYVIGVLVFVGLALQDSPQTVAGALATPSEGAAVRVLGAPSCFTVTPGEGGDAIASQLVEQQIVASERQFTLLLEYAGGGADLRAGVYQFHPGMAAAEVIRRLREGDTDDIQLSIPEGLRLEELSEWMETNEIVTAAAWAAAIEGARPEPIAAERPEGASLLGYLLPATYPLGCGELPNAESLVATMLDALDEQFTAALRAEAEAAGWSVHQVLTLASIVEKEAIMPDEQPLIASVLLNRLALGIALQTDPTVQFSIATANGGERGWWPEIFLEDLQYDSPYNTYQYPGLPPGPIANPGIGAITAVVRPAETDYFYFVARCDGSNRHEFAATLEEHNINVARCHGG